jgi:hypothetical protein
LAKRQIVSWAEWNGGQTKKRKNGKWENKQIGEKEKEQYAKKANGQ